MVYAHKDGKLVRSPGKHPGRRPSQASAVRRVSCARVGLYSTAEDLLHLYRMMLNDGVYEGHRYMSPFSVHVMTEPQATGIQPVGWIARIRLWPGVGGGDRPARRVGWTHGRAATATEELSVPGAGSIPAIT